MAHDTTPRDSAPVEHVRDLAAHLESGCKPRAAWRIGTEHEKFMVDADTCHRLPYAGPRGIRTLLAMLAGRTGWRPAHEDGALIGLKADDGASVTLEPGGQLELSGAPLETVHQTCAEVGGHLEHVRAIDRALGARATGLGFDPLSRRADVPWMPKGRYAIMRRHMPTRGAMGLDMMLRTCTVQVNLDFSSEADMARKMRVAVALQPMATALFANSPLREGRPSGMLSLRSHCWTDTDPDRCGMIPFVFEEGFGFARWVDYMLDVPMYFIRRGGTYHDVAGRSFRAFMEGKLPGFEGERPTIADWEDHLTTAFPEVRLKRFLEMRGADAGPWRNLCALPALWVGLLYDGAALDAAVDLTRGWTVADMQALRDAAPAMALRAPLGPSMRGAGRDMADLAAAALEIARGGLARRGRVDARGRTEAHFLAPLEEIVARRETQAEALLRRMETEWRGDLSQACAAWSY